MSNGRVDEHEESALAAAELRARLNRLIASAALGGLVGERTSRAEAKEAEDSVGAALQGLQRALASLPFLHPSTSRRETVSPSKDSSYDSSTRRKLTFHDTSHKAETFSNTREDKHRDVLRLSTADALLRGAMDKLDETCGSSVSDSRTKSPPLDQPYVHRYSSSIGKKSPMSSANNSSTNQSSSNTSAIDHNSTDYLKRGAASDKKTLQGTQKQHFPLQEQNGGSTSSRVGTRSQSTTERLTSTKSSTGLQRAFEAAVTPSLQRSGIVRSESASGRNLRRWERSRPENDSSKSLAPNLIGHNKENKTLNHTTANHLSINKALASTQPSTYYKQSFEHYKPSTTLSNKPQPQHQNYLKTLSTSSPIAQAASLSTPVRADYDLRTITKTEPSPVTWRSPASTACSFGDICGRPDPAEAIDDSTTTVEKVTEELLDLAAEAQRAAVAWPACKPLAAALRSMAIEELSLLQWLPRGDEPPEPTAHRRREAAIRAALCPEDPTQLAERLRNLRIAAAEGLAVMRQALFEAPSLDETSQRHVLAWTPDKEEPQLPSKPPAPISEPRTPDRPSRSLRPFSAPPRGRYTATEASWNASPASCPPWSTGAMQDEGHERRRQIFGSVARDMKEVVQQIRSTHQRR